MRDLLKWESTLRGREVDSNINDCGLKEFILHHNFFSSYLVKALSMRIKNDSYLKVIDLRFNHLTKEDVDEFLL